MPDDTKGGIRSKIMGFFGNIGSFFKKSFKSLSNPVKYLGDLGSALMPKNWFSDFNGDAGLFGSGFGDFQDFWDDYTGRGIAKDNLELQKAQFDYQKHLNDLQMMREDTAYQRKVKDMTTAGFNPILATGGSGSPSTALHAGPAPQMADTSGAVRESVGQVFGMLQGIAGLKKVNAETSLLKSQKDYQDIVNAHEDEYLGVRNSGMILDNQLKDGTLQSKIRQSIQEVDINDRKILIMDLEKMLKSKDINLKDIEIDIQKLVKEGKLTENQILDKKLELLSTKVLRECLDYENEKWDTEWYHKNYHLPKGFNPGWIGALGMFLGGLGGASVDHILNFFGGFIDSNNSSSSSDKPYTLSKSEMKQLLKRPEGSNFLWSRYMAAHEDYGVRRNF